MVSSTAITLPAVSHQRAVLFEVLIPLSNVYWVCVCASVRISPCWPLHGAVGRHLQCSHWSDQIDVCRPRRSCCHFPPSARPPVPSPQGGHTDRSPVTRVKLSRQTPNGQVFPTHNSFLYEKSLLHPYVLELLHRWVRSGGNSVKAFKSRMLPGDEEEFVPDGCNYPQLWAMVCVDRVQMTAWDRGGGDAGKRHYLRSVIPWRWMPRRHYKGQNTSSETAFHTFHGLFK